MVDRMIQHHAHIHNTNIHTHTYLHIIITTHNATTAWLKTACTAAASPPSFSAPNSARRCNRRVKGSVTWGVSSWGWRARGWWWSSSLKPGGGCCVFVLGGIVVVVECQWVWLVGLDCIFWGVDTDTCFPHTPPRHRGQSNAHKHIKHFNPNPHPNCSPCSAPVSKSSDTQPPLPFPPPSPSPLSSSSLWEGKGGKKRACGPCSPTSMGKGASVCVFF